MVRSTGNSYRSQRNRAIMLKDSLINWFYMGSVDHTDISLLLEKFDCRPKQLFPYLLKFSGAPAQKYLDSLLQWHPASPAKAPLKLVCLKYLSQLCKV